jgi:nicotinamidase-related amidase
MTEMSHGRTLIEPSSTALVVVDLQEKLLPAIEGAGKIIANVKNLLRLAQALGLKTLLTTQYRKGLGDTLPEIAELLSATPLDKICFGCMNDGPFRDELAKALPPGGSILLAGVETHICVMQTALGALEAGYRVHVISDATGSRTSNNGELGIQRMRDAGAVISSTEMAIYELLRDSRRPEFKQMLPYLK